MNRAGKALLLSASITISLIAGNVPGTEDAGRVEDEKTQKEFSVSIERIGSTRDLLRANVSFCTEISDKQCLDATGSFSIDTGRIFCHTVIQGAETYLEVKHLWYHNGIIDQVVRLPVKSAKWRTWSMKTLFPGAEGTWRVEIYAGDLKIGEGAFGITANGSLESGKD